MFEEIVGSQFITKLLIRERKLWQNLCSADELMREKIHHQNS